MLPDFFVIGAPKSGTTSLCDYLHQHPDVFISSHKEPHHFSYEDDGWPRWAVRDRAEYEDLFAEARPGQVLGEGSTWTLYSEGAPKRIAAAVPDARFVALLRHPTDRAFSNWTSNRRRGSEDMDTFEAALEAEPARVARRGWAWHDHYVRAGFYADQLERYFDAFGRDRVLVLLFDDLKADTPGVVRRVYEFIGVDGSFEPDTAKVHNKSYLPVSRRLHDFSRRSSRLKSTLKRVLPGNLGARLKGRVGALNRTDPPTIAPETQRRLDEMYRPHIERLSVLLGEDVTARWLDRSGPAGRGGTTG